MKQIKFKDLVKMIEANSNLDTILSSQELLKVEQQKHEQEILKNKSFNNSYFLLATGYIIDKYKFKL